MDKKAKSSLSIDTDKREITMVRTFDAPRELVFRAYTDPELIPQWWGPRGYKTVVEKLELEPGGAWRYVQYDPTGSQFAFHGVFHEVTPPKRLVYTFEYEGIPPGHVMVETVTFEDLGGKTRITATDVFQSLEDLEGMVNAGMEEGAVESFDRFAELLQKLQQPTHEPPTQKEQ